jgi:hypothetical protein
LQGQAVAYSELFGIFIALVMSASGLAALAARVWIKSSVEKSVQHKFDARIETVRAEFRSNEEKLKSELRAREDELSVIREKVLSGRANRDALVDARRLKAVERAWGSVTALASFKAISGSMAVIKLSEASKAAPIDAKVRKIFEIIVSPVPENKPPEDPAKNERPFLTPLAWAYLSAFRTIVVSSYMKAKALSMGIEDLNKLMPSENIKKVLKATLPEFSDYIDKNEPETFHYLLEYIEGKLLEELKKMLEGADVDKASVERSAVIMKAVNAAATETQKSAAEIRAQGAENEGARDRR